MKLLYLTASNVFSLGEATLELDDRGLVLITGYSYDEETGNGAGKSSLANKAILWGLYGKTSAGSKADSVINRHGKLATSYVLIEFEDSTRRRHRITRSRNPNRLEFVHFPAKPMGSVIDLTKKTEKETQALIDLTLGRDFKTFLQADFFGQGRKESFFELTPREQKNVIEGILPTEQLLEWAESAKQAVTRVRGTLSELQVSRATTEAQKDTLEDQLKSFTRMRVQWEADKNQKLSQIPPLDFDPEVLEKETKELRDRLGELNESIEKRREKLRSLNSTIMFTEHQMYETGKNHGACPTCGQVLPQAEWIALETKKTKLNQNLNELLNTQSEWVSEGNREHKEAESIDIELESNGKKLEQAKTYTLNKSFINVINPYDITLESTQTALNSTLEKSKKINRHLLAIQGEEKRVLAWEHAFTKDIRTLLLDSVCPFLKSECNQNLKALNNPQLKINISTIKRMKSKETKDEFNVTVNCETGGTEFDLLSGGEQQLLGFAFGMALSKLAGMSALGDSQILILDEPFEGLHEKNCDNVVNFLRANKTKGTILLISNDENLKSLIPNRIHVEKRQGVTTIATT